MGSEMIGFTYYKTYGIGCEDFWFRKLDDHLYQRVLRHGPFYWPVGAALNEHNCNYFKEVKGGSK